MAEKHAEYLQQLQQVEALLTATPTDAGLLQLKEDIKQLITLSGFVVPSSSSAQTSTPVPSSSSSSIATPALPTTGSARTEIKYNQGDRCMAPWTDGKYYLARVDYLLEQPSEEGDTSVTFLDYGNTEIVLQSTLQGYETAPAHLLLEGTEVRAVNPTDGLCYDAVVEGMVSLGRYRISFAKTSKNSKRKKTELNIEDILLPPKRLEVRSVTFFSFFFLFYWTELCVCVNLFVCMCECVCV